MMNHSIWQPLGTGRVLIWGISMGLLLNGCIIADSPFNGLPPGYWRGTLKLVNIPVTPNPKGQPLPEKTNMEFDEVTEGELPFVLEVKYSSPDSFYLEIINGQERIPLRDIEFGRNPRTGKDTFLIRFPVYQSYLRGEFSENVLEGEWVDETRENYRVPFLARHGRNHRFTTLQKKPFMDITGKWETTFETDTDHPYKAIGEFTQQGNQLFGTFLTETGDYRFLEGTVQGNKVYLSAFDGAHAFLFEAKILPDSTLLGGFRSGTRYQCAWEAKRNPLFQLRDPHELTGMKTGFSELSFRFKNASGEEITLENPRYANKVKVVQIMGTWCPNCRDETEFLVNYLRRNSNPDLEIIGLAFERFKEETKVWQALQNYKNQMNVPYEILHAGGARHDDASKALPMLTEVVAFPTLLLIDRKNRVRKIHAGFAGPATSGFEAFKKDFESSVRQLLNEKTVQ